MDLPPILFLHANLPLLKTNHLHLRTCTHCLLTTPHQASRFITLSSHPILEPIPPTTYCCSRPWFNDRETITYYTSDGTTWQKCNFHDYCNSISTTTADPIVDMEKVWDDTLDSNRKVGRMTETDKMRLRLEMKEKEQEKAKKVQNKRGVVKEVCMIEGKMVVRDVTAEVAAQREKAEKEEMRKEKRRQRDRLRKKEKGRIKAVPGGEDGQGKEEVELAACSACGKAFRGKIGLRMHILKCAAAKRRGIVEMVMEGRRRGEEARREVEGRTREAKA